MRDTKYRIWDKNNEKMMVDWQNFKFIKTVDKDSFLRLGSCGGGKWSIHLARIINYIPMQYTGFKDKNNKEIYESDVVECGGIPYEVYQHPSGDWQAGGMSIWEHISEDGVENGWEVIGNIYETKFTIYEDEEE